MWTDRRCVNVRRVLGARPKIHVPFAAIPSGSQTPTRVADHDTLLALVGRIARLDAVRLGTRAHLRDWNACASLVVEGVKREPVEVLPIRRLGCHHVVATGHERHFENAVPLLGFNGPMAERYRALAPPILVKREGTDG